MSVLRVEVATLKFLCPYKGMNYLEEGLKGKLRMYLKKISLDLEEEKELGMRLG